MKNNHSNNMDITVRVNNMKVKAKMGKKPTVTIKDLKHDKKYKINLYKLKKFKKFLDK
ncbi:hypothetical protein [Clostridium ihumii]|uniref:hypothetical protein n=1 Tax=Clostridium ihumii TaxID=1470356 RepID=UPI000A9CCA35|nr:hypothetical protein [Clostridium ihumii]